MKGYLLVRSEGKPYGLPVARVLEVGDATEVLPIPKKHGAVRGLTPLRGRLVPLVHLGSFLSGADAPPVAEQRAVRTVVLVELGVRGKAKGKQIAFEVDDADAVVREEPLPVPRGQGAPGTGRGSAGSAGELPWASGVAAQGAEGGSELVPILDLDSLGDRI